MKIKNFHDYLKKRLNKEEIEQIELQAKMELQVLQTLQNDVAKALNKYMEKNGIGFNELVRLLDASPTQIAKIQKGQANLTLSSIAHISALIGQEPHLIFKKK